MTRFALILACLPLTACSKDDAPRSRPAASAPPTAPSPVTVATPEPSAAPAARQTGVLDLEVLEVGDHHVVRNPTFEMTFPTAPELQPQTDQNPDGASVTSALVLASVGDEQLALVVSPMPKDRTFDTARGLAGARDGAIKNVGATFVREVDMKLGGLSGKRVTATASQGGKTYYFELYFAWDAPHHQLFMVITGSPAPSPSKLASDFVGSLVIKPA